MKNRDKFQLSQILLFLSLVAFAHPALAHIELNAFYSSDALGTDETISNSRMIIEGTVGFEIDKRGDYLVGWNYSMFTTSDSSGTTSAYSSSQMGPRFLYMIDRAKQWSLGIGYYLVTSATYDSGSGTAEKWKGTAFKVDIGYSFPVQDKWFIGLRGNYSSATYVEKLIGDTDYSTVSYTKSFMYPSIYTIFLF